MPDVAGLTSPITTTGAETAGLGRGDGASGDGAQVAASEADSVRAKWA